jgi:hypothetical protein
MRQTSGIIINNDIFINSSHVVKIEKRAESSTYTINIYMTNSESPIVISFDLENDRDIIFNKIVLELYGYNYAIVNF